MHLIKRFIVDEEGADATEYALVVGLIALGIVVGAGVMKGGIANALGTVGNRASSCSANSSGTNC